MFLGLQEIILHERVSQLIPTTIEIDRWRRLPVMAAEGPPSTPSLGTTQEDVDDQPAPAMTSDHDGRVGFKGGWYYTNDH